MTLCLVFSLGVFVVSIVTSLGHIRIQRRMKARNGELLEQNERLLAGATMASGVITTLVKENRDLYDAMLATKGGEVEAKRTFKSYVFLPN